MSKIHHEDDGKYVVQSLSRALHVLWTMAERNNGWTLDDLAQHHDLNKASMLRILRTLEADRVVLRDGDEYALGPRVLDLSNAYLDSLELEPAARPFMEQLAKDTGHTVSLAVLDGLEIVYVGFEKSNRELDIQDQVGARHPANATSLGKVMLADLDADELEARIQDRTLPRLTHRTLHTQAALAAHLNTVREQGYALDDEERGIGIRCLAAPIRRADGRVIAGVSIAGAIFHMRDEVISRYAERVREAADGISERFGFHAREPEPAGAGSGSAARKG